LLVTKEALNNVVRHAQAREVRLWIGTEAESIAILIEDDGQGFGQAPAAAGAEGLHNMRQRMEEIGGRIDIESASSGGTRISVVWPWLDSQEIGSSHHGQHADS
jgi:NarL family two-component system sensor histidine kinase LiaS